MQYLVHATYLLYYQVCPSSHAFNNVNNAAVNVPSSMLLQKLKDEFPKVKFNLRIGVNPTKERRRKMCQQKKIIKVKTKGEKEQ
jgi:hypothetical protein